MSKSSYYESDEFSFAATAKAVGTVLLATSVGGPVAGLATAAILYGTYKVTKTICDNSLKDNDSPSQDV